MLGSSKNKAFAAHKKIGVILHQKTSHLQNALFNNVLGLPAGKLGADILVEEKKQLATLYPAISQIENEKVIAVETTEEGYTVTANKNRYFSEIVIVALYYSQPFAIKGLESFVIPHKKANPAKERIQLRNENHLIKKGLYCCGTIAGWRSQFAITAGSGASVATDVLTLWNDGIPTKVHDKK